MTNEKDDITSQSTSDESDTSLRLSTEENSYEAASYVWGASQRSRHLTLFNGFVLITPNCKQALRYLRHRCRVWRLWVDSVCINQGDLTEKESQIAIMRDIYEHASHVLICLDPENKSWYSLCRVLHPLKLTGGTDKYSTPFKLTKKLSSVVFRESKAVGIPCRRTTPIFSSGEQNSLVRLTKNSI